MDGKCTDINFTDTGHSAHLRHAYRFESEKLINPANQVDTFNIVKTDISKSYSFYGPFFNN
jgi:hypothetical protein